MASIAREVCRLCLQYEEPVTDIFCEALSETKIITKIKKYLDLEVQFDTKKAKCICASCMKILDEFDLYYQQVQLNQDRFLEIEEEHLDGWMSEVEKLSVCSSNPDIKEVDFIDVEHIVDEDDGGLEEFFEEKIPTNLIVRKADDTFLNMVDDIKIEIDDSYEEIEYEEIPLKYEEPVEDYIEVSDVDEPITFEDEVELEPDNIKIQDSEVVEQYSEVVEQDCLEVLAHDDEPTKLMLEDAIIEEDTIEEEFNIDQEDYEDSNDSNGPVRDLPEEIIRDGEIIVQGATLINLITRFYKLECTICAKNSNDDYTFKKLSHLMGHFKIVHDIKGFVRCCNINLDTKVDMAVHIAQHIQPDGLKCKTCGKKCSNLRSYKSHKTLHAEEAPPKAFDDEHDKYPGFPKTIFKDGKLLFNGSEISDMINRFFKLECDLCKETAKGKLKFQKVSYLKGHYQLIHNVNGYIMCCDTRLSKRYQMVAHLLHHLQPEALLCKICQYECPSIKFHREHVKQHAEGKTPTMSFNCDICGVRCATKHFLEIHKVKLHKNNGSEISDSEDVVEKADEPHPDFPDLPKRIYSKQCRKIIRGAKLAGYIRKFFTFSCEICPENTVVFDDYPDLFAHYEKAHDQKGYVMCCSTKLKSYQYMTYHLAYHLQPDLFTCAICGKVHTKPEAVREHGQIHEPPEKKSYFCPKCPNRYGSQSGLRKHLITHIPKDQRPKFPCKECGKVFSNMGACQTHYKYSHVDQKLICELCGKSYKHNVALNLHRKTHHGPKKNDLAKRLYDQRECHICRQRFPTKPDVFKHLDEAHPKVHKCTECPYVGHKWILFERHRKETHTEKPYVCHMCDRRFKFHCTLRDHILQHKREHLHFCELCKKKYYSQSGLRRHQLREHLEEYQSILTGRKENRKGKPRPKVQIQGSRIVINGEASLAAKSVEELLINNIEEATMDVETSEQVIDVQN